MKLKIFVVVGLTALASGLAGPFKPIDVRAHTCVDLGEAMYPGMRLYPCDSLTSQNGRLTLRYQEDGNLVLYDTARTPHVAMWASGPADHNPGYLILQQPTAVDTNLFIVDGSGAAWFVSRPPCYQDGNLALIAQNDGNLVLYRDGVAVWDTATWF